MVSSLRLDTNTEKNIFYIFTIFFVFIVFTQLNIQDSFSVNDAVKQVIEGSGNTFTRSQTLNDFFFSYIDTIDLIYRDLRYTNPNDINQTDYRTLNNFNYIVSTVRLTQRRIKSKNNTSSISKNFIPEVWAGEGIAYDSNKKGFEFDGYYGPPSGLSGDARAAFAYNTNNSYLGKGGYVLNFNVYEISHSDIITILTSVMDNFWLDDRTASLILDFVVYNPYLEVLMYTKVTCGVDPSGRLTIKVLTEGIKRSYYTGALDIFRAICE